MADFDIIEDATLPPEKCLEYRKSKAEQDYVGAWLTENSGFSANKTHLPLAELELHSIEVARRRVEIPTRVLDAAEKVLVVRQDLARYHGDRDKGLIWCIGVFENIVKRMSNLPRTQSKAKPIMKTSPAFTCTANPYLVLARNQRLGSETKIASRVLKVQKNHAQANPSLRSDRLVPGVDPIEGKKLGDLGNHQWSLSNHEPILKPYRECRSTAADVRGLHVAAWMEEDFPPLPIRSKL